MALAFLDSVIALGLDMCYHRRTADRHETPPARSCILYRMQRAETGKPTVKERAKTRQQLIDELDELRRRVVNLEATNAQLSSIYDAANLVILAHNANYRIVYMNPHACRVFGYERDEMIGQPMDEMISELGEAERGGDLRSQLHHAPDKSFQRFEQYLRKKDRGLVLIRWDISALRDADGNYAGVVGVGQDITDRRRMEQEARQHRHSTLRNWLSSVRTVC